MTAMKTFYVVEH